MSIKLLFLWSHHHHHHHHVVPPARISLALFCHSSLYFITSGRSSGIHLVSSKSCCMYVRAGRPDFVRPYEGILRSTSLMSSSLLILKCPACLVRLTWIVFLKGGKWPYSLCFVGCCLHDLFNITCIHIVVSIRLLLGRNCVSFYRSDLTSIWSIDYR